MSRWSRIFKSINDAAKVYEGRDRYIRALKAFRDIEKIYRTHERDDVEDDEVEYHNAHLKAAQSMLDVCRNNGGIWIKVAQYLSCRPDLLPDEYIAALQTLQSDGKPTQFTPVNKVLEKSWGENWDAKFLHFEIIPVATASIAQVYKACLVDGSWVAVKVRIPGIEQVFEQDVFVFRSLAKLIGPLVKEIDIVQITEKIIEMSLHELNFIHEQENVEDFADLPVHQKVKVPKVYKALSNEEVLVAEWIDGPSLTQALNSMNAEVSKQLLSQLLVSLFHQVFQLGIFHADPHPGNFIVQEENIVMLDFGLTAKLSQSQKQNFLAILVTFAGGSSLDNLPNLFEKAGFSGVEPEVYVKMGEYIASNSDNQKLDRRLSDIIEQLRKRRVSIPDEFIALARVIVIIGGLSAVHDIDFQQALVDSMIS